MEKKSKFKKYMSELAADKVRLVILILLFIVMITTLVFMAVRLYGENEKKRDSKIAADIFDKNNKDAQAAETPGQASATEMPTELSTSTENIENSENSEKMPNSNDDDENTNSPTAVPRPVLQSIQSLRELYENKDIIGYLVIPGTEIKEPVVQSADDKLHRRNEFYLKRDLYKQDKEYGSIFMDYENNVSKEDKNIILYGHNMKAKIMFHEIRYYTGQSFYENHKYIIFTTLYETLVWEVFACYETHKSFYYIQVDFEDNDEFYQLASEMKSRSAVETGVEISPEDRVLTLSTCTNRDPDTRIVVNARLITKLEDIPQDIKDVYMSSINLKE